MTNTHKIELFSARVCPYAHRTRLALLEKGLEAELIEIDFKNKPKRFLEVSAYGKVPAIVHNGAEVYESAIINEYLEEVFPDPALMPKDPATRAQLRIWIDYCDDHYLDDFYGALRNQDRELDDALKEKVLAHLHRIEAAMQRLSNEGPYWLGAQVSLLDCAYYPFFERFPVLAHYRGIKIPKDCKRLSKWCDTMAERATVKSIANDPDYYIGRYASYARPEAAE